MTDDASDPRTERLAHPAVLAKIRAVLPPKVQPADADDIAQQVFVRLLLIDALPPTHDRLLGLAVVITHRALLDHFRRTGRRLAREAEVDHAEVLASPDPEISLDEEQQIRLVLESLERDVAAGKVSASMLRTARMLAEGKTVAEIAAATNRTEAAVKMETSRLRKHLREHWLKYMAAGGLGAFLALWFFVRRPGPDLAIGPDVSAMSSSSAAPSALPGTGISPLITAHELRRNAQQMCDEHFYPQCEKYLDDAKALDAPGDATPEVQAMRDAIPKRRAPVRPPVLPNEGPGKPVPPKP